MSSRQEEKERRRAEREARERAAAAGGARRRRLGLAVGGGLGLAAIAAVVIAVAAGGGGGNDVKKPGTGAKIPNVAIPAQKIAALGPAAKEAGCTLRHYPSYGNDHVEGAVTYKTNPPTSGDHNVNPAGDGNYIGSDAPDPINSVHSLEHGRVTIQYRPGLDKRKLGQLQALFDEQAGYHTLLFENTTQMPYEVAATAWTQLLGCKSLTSKTFDALRAFRARYTDQGPESVP